eukprot:m.178574 g.178574  ORF g.178574 m.178574 type:complete len:71 (+) comp31945_c2_seq9:884-1096(+)
MRVLQQLDRKSCFPQLELFNTKRATVQRKNMTTQKQTILTSQIAGVDDKHIILYFFRVRVFSFKKYKKNS